MRIMRRCILFTLATLAGCNPAKPRTGITPEVQLVEARALFRAGTFDKALSAYRRLVFELPAGDPGLAEVRYFQAECQMQMGEFAEAAHEFRDLADQAPESPYAAVALLRAGDANLRTWSDPALDPTPGQTALAVYQELAGRYPGTDAANRAQLHVRVLNDWFAEKDYHTGMFYFKRRSYDSGIIYFKDVIASYPDSKWVPTAMLRLADTYAIIGYGDELREVCGALRRFHPADAAGAASCPPDTTTAAH